MSLIAKFFWIKQLGLLNGVAIILAIYIHEYGHYFMASSLGYNPSKPKLIPFLGGFVKHDPINNDKDIFKIAFAGPLMGGILGILFVYIDLIFKSLFFHQLAFYSLFINAINLAPISFLDGGKIFQTLSSKKYISVIINIIAIIIGLAKQFYLLSIIGLLGIFFSSKNKETIKMEEKDKKFGYFVYIVFIILLLIHFAILKK